MKIAPFEMIGNGENNSDNGENKDFSIFAGMSGRNQA